MICRPVLFLPGYEFFARRMFWTLLTLALVVFYPSPYYHIALNNEEFPVMSHRTIIANRGDSGSLYYKISDDVDFFCL